MKATLSDGTLIEVDPTNYPSVAIRTPTVSMFLTDVKPVMGKYLNDNKLALYAYGMFMGKLHGLTEKDIQTVADLMRWNE